MEDDEPNHSFIESHCDVESPKLYYNSINYPKIKDSDK